MATSSLASLDQTLPLAFGGGGGSDRLSQEIFSILESNFLFGAPPPEGPAGYYSVGRVRVLSIDGGADGGALAAAALVRLERRLKELSGNPDARVADYFDLAAGSGAGGFLAAALFACRMPAEAARDVVAKNRKVFSGRRGRGGLFWRPESVFKKVFGDLTVRDAAKPLLIPCYDMATAAPFVFSRADAVEAEAFDFPLWQVCAAACGVGPTEVASLDGRTRLRAAAATGGGGAVSNPTAVAVTHVLHNKREFPFAAGAGDLVVLSLGGNNAAASPRASSSSLLRIAGACQADMVDQAVSMAFGECRATNYIRIQGNGIVAGAATTAEAAMTERSVESVLFRGKKLMTQTNGERLDGVAEQLVREDHLRMESKTPVVLIKPSATPRTSSSSASTLITVSTNASSESP
uniref:Patatin n=1 Tax=Oryza punctata TaxID=4537 RepID=A0A0E0LEN2_ORYPU